MFNNPPMSISHFIREIGRGKQGARHLTREQSQELMGLVLDGAVSDLELGAFCVAMRIKGETPEEMAGFLDATHQRLTCFRNPQTKPVLVLPSYNGARRLPLLTPLLAMLLAREGWPVLVHGGNTEDQRVATSQVMQTLDLPMLQQVRELHHGEVVWAPTALLSPGLWRLLQVRRNVGLRNPGHSLVKLMNVVHGPSLLVTCYTHPEYAVSMRETLQLMKTNALLLRGTEGEPVADFRRPPNMLTILNGTAEQDIESPSMPTEPLNLPHHLNASETALLIQQMLSGESEVPWPIQSQVATITAIAQRLSSS